MAARESESALVTAIRALVDDFRRAVRVLAKRPVLTGAAIVSDNPFDVVGVRPIVGRTYRLAALKSE
jgi:hypothetical protein